MLLAYRGAPGISDRAGEDLMDRLDALYFAAHREAKGSIKRRRAIARYAGLLDAAKRRFTMWLDFDEWLYLNDHRYLDTPIDP
ncbi:hypothetical protein QA639_25450 [Bradyrhizobium pachyrhizi]|uniref:hypothetical protein n=1 Tax=Bradyrhizobium pachyrhizi TaxID=280333 RepID=UPI0024B14543|nr:hypothetical protein [Bradyrhizobium pachyrhizi]WFU53021.1 hypothetical protein QA639_25450 [Bradyrhizobium pachyrhizi]